MEENIIEGNKRIADFMELKSFQDSRYGKMWDNPISKINGSCFGLEYHTSWAWLMPVVEKIEALGFNVQINRDNVDIVYTGALDERYPFFDSFGVIYSTFNCEGSTHAKPEAESKIHALWLSVTQFIEWFNSKTQQP